MAEMELTRLDWLVGDWIGHYGDDHVEEHWSGISGGVMMGMFRWVRGEAVRFYEFIVLERDGAHIVMRWKHFGADLVGWEEKDGFEDFVLVEVDERRARFQDRQSSEPTWLIYTLEDPNRLVVRFEKEGAPHGLTDKFVFTRAA